MFRNIQAIGKNRLYAEKGYVSMVEAGINLKFVSCSILDSEDFSGTGKTIENEAKKFLSRAIEKALQEAESKDKLLDVLADLSNKEKKQVDSDTFVLRQEIW